MNTLRRGAEAVLSTADLWPTSLGVLALGAALAGSIYVAAHPTEVDGDGHGRDSARYITALPDAKRVEHDYANWSDEAGDDCLEDTGYDPSDYKKYGDARKAYAVGTVNLRDGVIVVTPGKPDAGQPPLELVPNDGTRPLQPATTESAKILHDFGCETDTY